MSGSDYGQGSSREHAALAESFARIHRANLIDFGILPLLLDPPSGTTSHRGNARCCLLAAC